MAVPALWDHGESVFQAPASFTTGISETGISEGAPAVHRVGACLVEDAETAVRRGSRHPSVLEPGRNSLVQVSQIPRRFASGPAGEIPPGESIVKRCWRPGSSAKVSLTLFG